MFIGQRQNKEPIKDTEKGGPRVANQKSGLVMGTFKLAFVPQKSLRVSLLCGKEPYSRFVLYILFNRPKIGCFSKAALVTFSRK